MNQYLVFRLYGPMASWGEPAVGGDRHTASRPTRSAILGLIAGAMGINRDDESRLQSLNDSVTVAVKQRSAGTVMCDYHTSQVPTHKKGFVHRTRRHELADKQALNTVLSSRYYICDGLWNVALTPVGNAEFSLTSLEKALQEPAYVPYLGRKAFTLGAPLDQKVVEAESLKHALDTKFTPITNSERQDQYLLGLSESPTYFWEGDPKAIEGNTANQINQVCDKIVNRAKWHFATRVEYQLTIKEVCQ